MITLLALLVGRTDAVAASSIVINPTTAGGDVYIVSAVGLVDAALIDFTFSYDTATLANPKVVPGQLAIASNANMEAVTSTEGAVRVVFITDGVFKDRGQLATITFSRVGKLPGRVFDLNADVFSNSSEQVAVEPVIGTSKATIDQPPADQEAADQSEQQAAQKAAADSKAATGATAATSGSDMSNIVDEAARQSQQQQPGAYQDSVTSSGNSPLQQESRREEPRRDEQTRQERTGAVPQEADADSTASAVSARDDGAKSSTAKSPIEALALLKGAEMPLQRFRAFKGARTVAGLVPLFDASAARKAGVDQEPGIAVSDGKQIVTVTIELAASGMVPNFSLRGANLKSIRPVTDKAWELDALPQKGKYAVKLSVLLGKDHVDIPLVVIPPLDAAMIRETRELTEAGVNALLAKVDPMSGKIVYDLNSDGRQDFLDDFILVAHYLLKNPTTAKPAKKIN